MIEAIKASLEDAKSTISNFIDNSENIDQMNRAVSMIMDSFKSNGTVFSCGNGGSMCDAMHFAEELTGRFRKERRPLSAIAISDPSHISCVANDYGYDFIFSRYVEALGKDGDVLLAISTSGNSPNVINAVNAAKNKKMKTIALLGKDGGKLKNIVDVPLIVPSNSSDRIQEVHIKIIHTVIEAVERTFFPENYR